MADVPRPPPSAMPYVWAGLILVLMAGLFVLALLSLRPGLDPLILIASVGGVFGTMFTGVSAYLKSQETHLTVNSQLSEWKQEFYALAHAKGVMAGAEQEQARIAEQLRVRNLNAQVSVPDPPVTVQNP